MQTRRITQLLGLILGNGYFSALSSGTIYKGMLKGGCVPFLNCYACPLAIFSCPIGTIQHFMTIQAIPLLLLGTLGLIGLFLGRMACGWLCPFGLLQDLLYKIPSDKISIPDSLKFFKYFTLVVLVVAIPYFSGVPWFSKLCPAGTLSAGIPWVVLDPHNPKTGQGVIDMNELGVLFLIKLLILGVFLVLFVMTKRPFCRTTCPLGAIFSLFNRLSLVRINISENCRRCGHCQTLCPVDLKACQGANSTECIRCLNCTSCKHVSVEMSLPALLPPPSLDVEEHQPLREKGAVDIP